MQIVLLTLPMKPGKLNEYKAFAEEIMGPRKEEYKDLLNRYGLKSVNVWHAKLADRDYVIVMHDADEKAKEHLQRWSSSTHPFDQWFSAQLLKCYDIKDFDHLPEQPEFLFGLQLKS